MAFRARLSRFVLALSLLSAPLSAWAGAGGLFFGIQRPDLAPTFLPASGAESGIENLGGFGYGVDREGRITGGFGMAFLDEGFLGAASETQSLAGGIGGMIVGRRIIDGISVDLDLVLRLGLGGAALKSGSWSGWAVAYAEPYLELVLAGTPWMAISAQVGYRFMGNVAPGLAFNEFFLRSPVIGLAISWGSFR